MKKTLALLLVAIMAISCTLVALTVSAEEPVYTDKVNLLPASEKDISSDTKAGYKLADGKLSLTRTEDSTVAWPSIVYSTNIELDLAKTPYLHMSFETSGEGDRGVNGHLNITDSKGDEFAFQLSMLAGDSVNDFRDTDERYVKIDLAAAIKGYIEYIKSLGEPEPEVDFDVTGKLTITSIDLSVYGGVGETIVWNTLALAKEGADEGDDSSEDDTTTPAEGDTTSDEGNTTTPAEDSSSSEAPANSSSTPAESSSDKVPTGDAGVILFAVLAVVALAGVAVAVKVRH